MAWILKEELIERAYEEAQKMDEPYKDTLGPTVEWLADKTTCGYTINADSEPVRHGHWKFPVFPDCIDAYDPRCECSVCGSIETPLSRHNYCPNCGAKMDEKEETDAF